MPYNARDVAAPWYQDAGQRLTLDPLDGVARQVPLGGDPPDPDDRLSAEYDMEMALDRRGLPIIWPATLHLLSWLQVTRAIDGVPLHPQLQWPL